MKYDELDWLVITDRKHGHKFEIGEKVMVMESENNDIYLVSNGSKEDWVESDEVKLSE